MTRTLIVDTTNLSTIQYMKNPALDSDGNPAGLIIGTLKALRTICRYLKPDKMICVFDGSGGSVKRRKIQKDYKDGRKPVESRAVVGIHYAFGDTESAEKNRSWQIATLKDILESLPVNVITTDNYEADDAISYIVNNSEDYGHDSNIIVSCDKDFFQLVTSKAVIFNPMKKQLLSADKIVEEYGVHPINWLFYRAIDGDPGDNIKGVKGFGPKTISKLFPVNKSIPVKIEDIEENYNRVILEEKQTTEKKRFTKLHENLETIKTNMKLMSLHEPMLSVNDKDNLDKKLVNFKPSLDHKDIYIKLVRLGVDIEYSFTEEFKRLL